MFSQSLVIMWTGSANGIEPPRSDFVSDLDDAGQVHTLAAVSRAGPQLPPDMPSMPMILAANANAQGSHVGEWRHPDAWARPAANIANAVRLAEIAEAGLMDLLRGRSCRSAG